MKSAFFSLFCLLFIFLFTYSSVSYEDKNAENYCDALISFRGDNLKLIKRRLGRYENYRLKIPVSKSPSFLMLPIVELPFSFEECVPSWAIKCPEDASYAVFIRIGGEYGLSDWLLAGEWNCELTSSKIRSLVLNGNLNETLSASQKNSYAEIRADYLIASVDSDKIQLLFVFLPSDRCAGDFEIASISAAASTHRGDLRLRLYDRSLNVIPHNLSIPFRSQAWEDKSIAGEVCSVVSTAMIMDYYGVDEKTSNLAKSAYDKRHNMYGMWWKAIASASTYGFDGYVRYFRSWEDVQKFTSNGMPIAACILFDEGELANAATIASEGHVLVISGFSELGDVYCADGAFRDQESGLVLYDRHEMEKAWFINGGGIGYVIFPFNSYGEKLKGNILFEL